MTVRHFGASLHEELATCSMLSLLLYQSTVESTPYQKIQEFYQLQVLYNSMG